MSRVYIHEEVDIVGPNRARYQHHVTANWCPAARSVRDQLCFGVWSVVGSTGRWPAVVNLWEYPSWDALGRNFAHELVGAGHQDPELALWWERAASFRSGGFDRVLVAADWSPGVAELCAAGRSAVGYVHEWWTVAPGRAGEFLEGLVVLSGLRADVGLRCTAAMRTSMGADREVLAIWEFDDWATWAAFEARGGAGSPGEMGWRELVPQVSDRRSVLLVDAELSPLRTGRQPLEADRRPLGEL